MASTTNRERQTDTSSTKVYALFLILWFLTVIYAFAVVKKDTNTKDSEEQIEEFTHALYQNRWDIILRVVICINLCIGYLFVLRYLNKCCIYVGISVMLIFLIFEAYEILLQLYEFNFWHLIFIVFQTLSLIVLLTALYGAVKIGVHEISNLIDNSCRFLRFYPYSLLIGTVFHVLILAVLVFTTTIHEYLERIDYDNLYLHILTIIFQYINILCFLWTLFLIYDFEFIILCAAFTSWYKAEDKSMLTNTQINRNIISILRSHYGTIIYGSSIMSIIRELQAVLKYEEFTPQNVVRRRPVSWICRYYLIFPPRMFTECSYTMTVLDGTDFYVSANKAYDLIIQNPLKFIVITVIGEWVINIGFVGIVMSLILSYIYGGFPQTEHYKVIFFITCFFVIIASSIIYTALYSAVCSFVMCTFKNSKDEDKESFDTNVPAMTV